MVRYYIYWWLMILAFDGLSQEAFLEEIGPRKAKSFEYLITSYRQFLDLNYPDIDGLGGQTQAYMFHLLESYNEEITPPVNDSLRAIQTLIELESTGLRKDIFLVQNEDNEEVYPIEELIGISEEWKADDNKYYDWTQDSSLQEYIAQLPEKEKVAFIERQNERAARYKWVAYPNPNALFSYALAKKDTSMYAYCRLRYQGMSPALTDAILKRSPEELESWNAQIILMIDYYLSEIIYKYRRYLVDDFGER